MRGLVNVLARRSLVVEDEAVKRRIGAMGNRLLREECLGLCKCE